MGRPELENKKSRIDIQRDYRQKNKEKIREYNKFADKTPEGKKRKIKSKWKSRGLDMDTFYYVYPIFLNATHCEHCNVEFEDNKGRNQKCMDHCHATGMFRNVVCRVCNQKIRSIGKIK